jgi:hypothetical protein
LRWAIEIDLDLDPEIEKKAEEERIVGLQRMN